MGSKGIRYQVSGISTTIVLLSSSLLRCCLVQITMDFISETLAYVIAILLSNTQEHFDEGLEEICRPVDCW